MKKLHEIKFKKATIVAIIDFMNHPCKISTYKLWHNKDLLAVHIARESTITRIRPLRGFKKGDTLRLICNRWKDVQGQIFYQGVKK